MKKQTNTIDTVRGESKKERKREKGKKATTGDQRKKEKGPLVANMTANPTFSRDCHSSARNIQRSKEGYALRDRNVFLRFCCRNLLFQILKHAHRHAGCVKEEEEEKQEDPQVHLASLFFGSKTGQAFGPAFSSGRAVALPIGSFCIASASVSLSPFAPKFPRDVDALHSTANI